MEPGRRAALGSGSLPRPLTSFVGRERELAEARRLLEGSRLLTLTGPGGSGKTRLCIELAAQVAAGYPDGVCFVRLAPVREPGLVPSSIAQSIGLPDSQGPSLVEHLASYLRDRKLLLVLDNFEHLLAAAPVVAELLAPARALRIVMSSRSPLRVSGEQECPVPPLAVPQQDALTTAQSVAGCESVRLFAERAAAAVPGFSVDEQNAAAVAQIVRRLDGLPLAIELAAARVRLLPPEAILGRLEHSLSLLVGGSRDLPDRQQTLRATIEWSYDLLGDEARRLLAACSVFRGGVPLEVIEPVWAEAGTGVAVLDGLQELVDQSLLRPVRASGTPRYLMLETIREFAAERLAGTPEAARLRGAHAASFLALAGEAGRPLTGLGQKDWLERLDVEHNNIRAAIDWYRQEDPPAALRLAAVMWLFWSLHGHFTEGRQRLRQLLGLVPNQTTVRVRALNGAAWLAIDQGDYPDADRLLSESTELSGRLNDKVGEGMAAAFLCRSMLSSDRVAEAAQYSQRAPGPASIRWRCGWLAPRRPAEMPTSPPCPSRTGRILTAGWRHRSGRSEQQRRGLSPRAADDTDGGPGVCAGRRARASLAARPAADTYPPRGAGRRAGGPWPDQPRHWRPAVPVGPHGRGACRPHPDQAGLSHSHSAGRLGAREGTAGGKYVVPK